MTDSSSQNPRFKFERKSSIEKPKRKFHFSKFTDTQISILLENYNVKKYITREERKKISQLVELTEKQVMTWFQNRRKREKKRRNDETIENRCNQYLIELVRNIDIETVNDMLQYMDSYGYYELTQSFLEAARQDLDACPHDVFHRAAAKCPCAGGPQKIVNTMHSQV